MSRLTASRAAFDLIASFEGFRTRAALAPDGQWTFGFGHTVTAREGLTVTRAEAEDLLRWDLLQVEDMVRQAALTPLTQNQFDALISFVYNIGIENFRTSDVLKFLNQGQPVAAALSMHAWRRAPVNGRVLTIDALVRRRAAESALFLETVGARPAAPSSVIRPQIDATAALVAHAPVPADMETDAVADGDIELPVEETVREGAVPAATVPEEVALVEADTVVEAVVPDEVPEATTLFPVEEVLAPIDASTPIVTRAAATSQDVLVQAPVEAIKPAPPPEAQPPQILAQGPVILPTMPIPPLVDLNDVTVKSGSILTPVAGTGPMIPDGLSPFPGSAVYTPANGTSDTITTPANDGQNTRLHNTPEILDAPDQPPVAVAKKAADADTGFSALTLGLMALGALLLGFGLYFSWKSGILTVTTPRREPTVNELWALFAAVSGFMIIITSAVSALTANKDDA